VSSRKKKALNLPMILLLSAEGNLKQRKKARKRLYERSKKRRNTD
jgi:hypothetical protein